MFRQGEFTHPPSIYNPRRIQANETVFILFNCLLQSSGEKIPLEFGGFLHLLLNFPSTFVKELKQINPSDPSTERLTWDLSVISAAKGKSKVADKTASVCGGPRDRLLPNQFAML